MSYPIQRQSESYGVFDDGLRFARDYETRDLPPGLADMINSGPRISAGLNNPGNRKQAYGLDDFSHGPRSGDFGRDGGPVNPPSTYAPDTTELREREEEEFNRDFGPGADKPHYTEEAFREEPRTQLQPLHQLLEERDTPLPPEPHDYLAQFRPHMASFTEARLLEAEEGGPAPGPLFSPLLFQPKAPSLDSMLLGDEQAYANAPQAQGQWVTALAAPPQQAPAVDPAAAAMPGWIGHGYAPGHRVGLPWREQVIPGTVTHLDGQEVGIRWDDGQHSTEEPKDLRPL